MKRLTRFLHFEISEALAEKLAYLMRKEHRSGISIAHQALEEYLAGHRRRPLGTPVLAEEVTND